MDALRRVTVDDFPLIATWLAEPLVRRWWFQDFTSEALDRDFGAAVRGERSDEAFILVSGGRDVGLPQSCLIADAPKDRAALSKLVDVPNGALTLDYFIGIDDFRGSGRGPLFIALAAADLFGRYQESDCIIVPVAAANRRSWRALKKAGFRFIGSGFLEPDNAADDGEHVVYRLDRRRD